MTFIDTNVFIYAVGREHPLKAPSARVIEHIGSGQLEAAVSTEVLQELLYVFDRRSQREAGLLLVREITDLIPEPLPVAKPDVSAATLFMSRYGRLNTRDAIHLGSMLTHGISDIVSADVHFDDIEGIERIDPASF